MLIAVVVEPGDSVGMLARATGMSVSRLRLLDGALVLKVKRWRGGGGADPGIFGGFVRHGTDRSRTAVSVRWYFAENDAPAAEPCRDDEAADAAFIAHWALPDRPGRIPGGPIPDSDNYPVTIERKTDGRHIVSFLDLDVAESAVRRMLKPDHPTKATTIKRPQRRLGKRLTVTVGEAS